MDFCDALAALDPDAKSPCRLRQRAEGAWAGVDDHRHHQPGAVQRDGGAVGVVVVGDDHSSVAGADREVHDIIAHRPCQHDAGNIVAGQGQRTLDRAGGSDDPARPNAPQPMLGPPVAGGMVGHVFIGQDIAVIINPGRHAARAQGNIVHLSQCFDGGVDPRIGGFAVDLDLVHRGATAPGGGLFQHHHPRPGLGRHQRRLQPGDTTTHHQHVAEGIDIFIAVGVAILRHPAKTGRAAHDRLEHMLPRRARIHEGLVVEPARQHLCDVVVKHADIKFEAGPVVLAFRREPVKEFGGGGALIGLESPARAHVHQRVGFLDPRGQNAARAVILEAAPDHHLVVGQQGGGQGIALEAAQAFAVEGEFLNRGALDQTATRCQTRAHL